jgi:hypothetical protein
MFMYENVTTTIKTRDRERENDSFLSKGWCASGFSA